MGNVAVIGAGAAGLMAAAAAAKSGNNVTVFEKNEKAGKKIYITGKGRCNLTNACDTNEFFEHVVRNPKFLYSSIYGFDQSQTIEFFEQNGCMTKTERGKRVFPVSDHAYDVTDALMFYLRKHNVKVRFGKEISGITVRELETKDSDPLVSENERMAKKGGKKAKKQTSAVTGVQLADGSVQPFDNVIVCTGGLSYPSTGSTGDGYKFAAETGHAVTNTAPSLVPLVTKEKWCTDLQGLSLKNVAVTIYPGAEDREKKKKPRPVYSGFGEMLFTHFGLSGPLILTGSCYCDFEKYKTFNLVLDLKPALSVQQLEDRMHREFEAAPGKHLVNALRSLFPARLAETVADLSGLESDVPVGRIGEGQIQSLAGLIKAVSITLISARGYNEAIITKGGVSVKDIDPGTMESKIVRGLFFAGEVLDVDAHTGGFNLQIAWSTGRQAGSHVHEI